METRTSSCDLVSICNLCLNIWQQDSKWDMKRVKWFVKFMQYMCRRETLSLAVGWLAWSFSLR